MIPSGHINQSHRLYAEWVRLLHLLRFSASSFRVQISVARPPKLVLEHDSAQGAGLRPSAHDRPPSTRAAPGVSPRTRSKPGELVVAPLGTVELPPRAAQRSRSDARRRRWHGARPMELPGFAAITLSLD